MREELRNLNYDVPTVMYGAVNYDFGAAACYFMGAYGGLRTRSGRMCISVGEGVQKAFPLLGLNGQRIHSSHEKRDS